MMIRETGKVKVIALFVVVFFGKTLKEDLKMLGKQ